MDFGVDLIVVGTTGGFAVMLNRDEGYMNVSLGRVTIGGRPAASLRSLRASARRLRSKLSSMAAPCEVEPILCCANATLGAPRNVKGVWVARPGDMVRLIARRPNAVPRQTAKRVAQALGAKTRVTRPRDD